MSGNITAFIIIINIFERIELLGEVEVLILSHSLEDHKDKHLFPQIQPRNGVHQVPFLSQVTNAEQDVHDCNHFSFTDLFRMVLEGLEGHLSK